MTELSLKKSFFEWPFKNPVDWLVAAIYGLLLITIYYSAFNWLITNDWAREDYSYAYLIPFIVIYLVWDKRDRLKEQENRTSWMGLLPLGIGFAFFWLGELGGELFSIYISFWLILVGLCWTHLGRKKLKTIAFPLFLMLALFPLPSFIYNTVTLQLRLISSKLAVDMMQFFGLSAFREGNVIDLGFIKLQVVEACSGLRFVIPLLILSLLVAYFYRTYLWKRVVLVISSIPISILMNSLRIALTGVLFEVWGQEVAEGFFHSFSGWVLFIASLVVLLIEILILRLIPPKRARGVSQGQTILELDPESGESFKSNDLLDDKQADTEEMASHKVAPEFLSKANIWAFLKLPQFLTAVVILATMLIASQSIEFREKIPLSQSLVNFPLKIGQWNGTRQIIEQELIDALDFTDYVMVGYKDPRNYHVNFYVAYYESQRTGESIHSPESCLPGAGWSFEEEKVTTLPIPGPYGDSLPVSRAIMKKGDARQLVYFWFPSRDRILTNIYQLKLYTFWDALTKQRTDGALVRLITPVLKTEKLEEADERLTAFAREILPVLNKYLPSADL